MLGAPYYFPDWFIKITADLTRIMDSLYFIFWFSDEENTAFEAASTTSPQKRPNGQLLAASRSSSRLNSVRQLASAGRSTPVLGGCITPVAAAAGGLAARPSRMSKSATKTDLNRKTTSASRPSVLGAHN